jgi:hypothetical protein
MFFMIFVQNLVKIIMGDQYVFTNFFKKFEQKYEETIRKIFHFFDLRWGELSRLPPSYVSGSDFPIFF